MHVSVPGAGNDSVAKSVSVAPGGIVSPVWESMHGALSVTALGTESLFVTKNGIATGVSGHTDVSRGGMSVMRGAMTETDSASV